MDTSTILIVEDDADLSAIVADYVRAAGHAAEVLGDGQAALARVQQAPPTLIVLDLMLPGLDGLALCRAVRAFCDVPIIMTTARVEEIDRLLGLESGADDYLCKPFSPRELVARIQAVLRRLRGTTAAGPAADTPPLRIDEATRRAFVHARPLTLTPTEFELLAALARRPGTIFSRAQLLDIARADALDVTDRAVDSHIKNLRRKLAERAPELDLIQSVYGLGYRLEF